MTPAFTDQVNNYVQTVIAVDTSTVENGCLNIVPGSHKLGNLKVKRYADGQIEEHIDVSTAVACQAPAGSVILFTPYTVHGSTPNLSNQPRRSYINGFVRASSCTICKWVFLDGQGVPMTSDHDYSELRRLIS
jgi:phytanoyl-CoA hydroxylase